MSYFEPLIEFPDEDLPEGVVPLYKPPTFKEQDAGNALFDQHWDTDKPNPTMDEWRAVVDPKLHDMKVPDDNPLPDDWKDQYYNSGWYRSKIIDIAFRLFFRPSVRRRIDEARTRAIQAAASNDIPGTTAGGLERSGTRPTDPEGGREGKSTVLVSDS